MTRPPSIKDIRIFFVNEKVDDNFTIRHKIVTIDTPDARDLHGKLSLRVIGGNALCGKF